MQKFLKWFGCIRTQATGESTPAAVCVEESPDPRTGILPRYWMENEDSVKVTTSRVQLPCCEREGIEMKIWNQRQLQFFATAEFNCYKLQHKLPGATRLFGQQFYSPRTGVLTCRFHGPNPRCIFCGRTFSRHSIIEAKDMCKSLTDLDLVSILESDPMLRSSVQLVEPRYWITYDRNMALFEADLEGCDYSSQIKFHVANNSVVFYAFLSLQRRYFLEFRLESCTEGEWKVNFDPNLRMLTCTIPLLRCYECSRCRAVQQNDGAPNTEKNGQSTEKVVRVDVEKVVGCVGKRNGQEGEEDSWSTNMPATCSSKASSLVDVVDEEFQSLDSPVQVTLHTGTSV